MKHLYSTYEATIEEFEWFLKQCLKKKHKNEDELRLRIHFGKIEAWNGERFTNAYAQFLLKKGIASWVQYRVVGNLIYIDIPTEIPVEEILS